MKLLTLFLVSLFVFAALGVAAVYSGPSPLIPNKNSTYSYAHTYKKYATNTFVFTHSGEYESNLNKLPKHRVEDSMTWPKSSQSKARYTY